MIDQSQYTYMYTAISKKVAPVIHDARSMFHSRRCTMVECYCERDRNKFLPLNGPQKAETK